MTGVLAMFERIPEEKALQSAQITAETAQYLAQGGTITPCDPCKETWQLYAVAYGDEGITLRKCKVLPDLTERKLRNAPGKIQEAQRGAYKAAREAGETPMQAKRTARQAARKYTSAGSTTI